MVIRRLNIASTPHSLLVTSMVAAAFLLFLMTEPHLIVAQDAGRSQETAKSCTNTKVVARGKYIVEGSRVVGTVTLLVIAMVTPTTQGGLRVDRCSMNQLDRCQGGQLALLVLQARHQGPTQKSLHS
jgi:hypothetical protein